jgi:hypothetical protein
MFHHLVAPASWGKPGHFLFPTPALPPIACIARLKIKVLKGFKLAREMYMGGVPKFYFQMLQSFQH